MKHFFLLLIVFAYLIHQQWKMQELSIQLFEKNFAEMTVRAVGITLQNLVDIKDMKVQMTFFDYERNLCFKI